ncbi:MAG: tRNA threonylcarbamoyl adenosine modification protein YeaZ [Rhodobacteraceae bacterium HLUCCO07]|nr:MAG: tRNA threonylcarbamoyl adenosine modification protein YeaZ [Rhodobacteraceae bacterium HLUCCO07]
MGRGQAERLMPLLDETLTEAGLGWNDLSAIGVGTGPGNFTGIRISVATARGLALALGIPAIGVTRFDTLAFGQPRPCITLVDAPRGQVYLQRFEESGAAPPKLSMLDEIDARSGYLNQRWIGSHAEECAARLSGVVSEPTLAGVEAIARIAANRIETNTTPPAPLYIRPADAAPARDAAPELLDDT